MRPGLAQKERRRVQARFGMGRMLIEHGLFRRGEDAVQSPQNGEREDDLAVLGLLVVATDQMKAERLTVKIEYADPCNGY